MTTKKERPVLPWAEVFELCHRQGSNKPIHVQVVETGPGLLHVRNGDELFLHEILTNKISVKRLPDPPFADGELGASTKFRKGSNEGVEILLPLQYSGRFVLYPRHPLAHCFQSVQEILDSLPAVSRLIYPGEAFDIAGQHVRAMERLEITNVIQDPSSGTEMLCVHSMKTGAQLLLPARQRTRFVQLSNECFKCGHAGLTPLEFILSWKPGQPPFRVKLSQSHPDVPGLGLSVPKAEKEKKGKKGKKKKHLSSCDLDDIKTSDLQSAPDDRWLIPESWRNKFLLVKPFQKMLVKNIMFDCKDFKLPETAKMTVRVLSVDLFPDVASVDEVTDTRQQSSSLPGTFSGALRDLPTELATRSKTPLLLIITAGSMSTISRQQMKISQGCRLAVHQIRRSTKVLMICSKSQRFLVSLFYAGLFKQAVPHSLIFRVEHLKNAVLPCKVEVTTADQSLGYDQLARRKELTALELLPETSLIVEIFGPSGQVISEQPLEIPLSRTNLSVQVLEASSYNLTGTMPLDAVKQLPAVEFVSESDVDVLRKSLQITEESTSNYRLERGPPSPEFLLPPQKELRPPDLTENRAKEILTLAGEVPPRPPKSPILREMQSTQSSAIVAPARPPKPSRFKEDIDRQSYNFNFNNSNKTEIPPFDATRSKIQGTRPGDRDFQEMHERFDPGLIVPTEELITIEEDPRELKAPVSNSRFDVGVYGELSTRRKPYNGIKNVLKKVTRGKEKHGSGMTNPNYDTHFGNLRISDPAHQEYTANEDHDNPLYEYAIDSPRENLPSFADDYEEPFSPIARKQESSADQDLYGIPWKGNAGEQKIASESSDEYEDVLVS